MKQPPTDVDGVHDAIELIPRYDYTVRPEEGKGMGTAGEEEEKCAGLASAKSSR
jgi:hypothetical protein